MNNTSPEVRISVGRLGTMLEEAFPDEVEQKDSNGVEWTALDQALVYFLGFPKIDETFFIGIAKVVAENSGYSKSWPEIEKALTVKITEIKTLSAEEKKQRVIVGIDLAIENFISDLVNHGVPGVAYQDVMHSAEFMDLVARRLKIYGEQKYMDVTLH